MRRDWVKKVIPSDTGKGCGAGSKRAGDTGIGETLENFPKCNEFTHRHCKFGTKAPESFYKPLWTWQI